MRKKTLKKDLLLEKLIESAIIELIEQEETRPGLLQNIKQKLVTAGSAIKSTVGSAFGKVQDLLNFAKKREEEFKRNAITVDQQINNITTNVTTNLENLKTTLIKTLAQAYRVNQPQQPQQPQ